MGERFITQADEVSEPGDRSRWLMVTDIPVLEQTGNTSVGGERAEVERVSWWGVHTFSQGNSIIGINRVRETGGRHRGRHRDTQRKRELE